jgi:hypothetical protein
MKKRIIIIPLILFATSSLYAQEKVIYNSDGTVGPKKIQMTHNGISTPVDVSKVNSDGTPKSNHPSTQVSYDKVTIVNVAEVNDDGTPIGYKQTTQLSKPQVVKVEVDDNDLSYRTNGNAAKRDLIGKNEDPLRNTNPRDLIGKNENAPRKGGVQIPNNQNAETSQVNNKVSNVPQSSTTTVNSKGNVISEADQKLSDTELNKKYPNRNGSYTKPVTGNNTTVSDKEKSNQPLNAPQYFKNIEKNDPKSDALKTNK